MKVLLLHVDSIRYETHKNALRNPPDPPGSYEAGESVVAYITVEAGDDERVARAAARDIVEYASKTVKAPRIVLYPYAHLSSNLEKPHRAHRLLVRLEQLVREAFQGEVHRAPFGWYKSFTIRAKGHPLAELSRHYTPQALIEYRLQDETLTPEEASSRGLLPQCLVKPKPPTGLAREKLEALGLADKGSWQYRAMVESLARRLAGPGYRVEYVEAGRGLSASIRLLRAGIEAGPKTMVRSGPEAVVTVPSEAAREVLDELSPGLASRVERVPLCGEPPCLDAGLEGSLLVYKSPSGWCTLVGLESGGLVALGPVDGLLEAVVEHEAWKAQSQDWVPRLPAWLHPVTVYIVPVHGAEEYADTLARDLAYTAGARVIVDLSTRSLGPRIRRAGRMWVPLVVTIGPREAETGTVTVRRRWRPGEQETLSAVSLVEEVRGLLHPVGGAGLIYTLTGQS